MQHSTFCQITKTNKGFLNFVPQTTVCFVLLLIWCLFASLEEHNNNPIMQHRKPPLEGKAVFFGQVPSPHHVLSLPSKQPHSLSALQGHHTFFPHQLLLGVPSRTVFVRNIDPNTQEEQIKTLFDPFGEVRRYHLALMHVNTILFLVFVLLSHGGDDGDTLIIVI
jgi:hypothetical protein